MLRPIEEEWKDLAKTVMPDIAEQSHQYKELRRVFYCGAAVVFASLEGFENDASVDDCSDYLDRLEADLHQFAKEIMETK